MRIGIIGLGYVGWPLALALSDRNDVTGIDINDRRLTEIASVARKERITIANDFQELDRRECQIIIVCVPTDVDQAKQPDLQPLKEVAAAIAEHGEKAWLIINESTVYPGATQEIFGPGLREHQYLGYSPERIVPGAPKSELNGAGRTLANTFKIVASSNAWARDTMAALYRPITGGLHMCEDMRVAEMAKLLENCQRDLNIALMNEAAVLADRMGIRIHQVLEAAGTKWNFHAYQPGLVGGHCIGVDPYYLAWAGARLGVRSDLILTGRRVNDQMATHVAQWMVKAQAKSVLILGWAFKENCGDYRNTLVADIRRELLQFGCQVVVYDPLIDQQTADRLDIFTNLDSLRGHAVDSLLLAVPHDQIMDELVVLRETLTGQPGGRIFDLKNRLPNDPLALRL